MKRARIIFLLNSNEFDGGSRIIYELARELRESMEITVFVPIIPRYRLFVLEDCTNLGPLRSFVRKFRYCVRWIALEALDRNFKWVYGRSRIVPYRRCIFSPPKELLREADRVVLNSWYHILAISDIWQAQPEKFLVFHHHVEKYNNKSSLTARDKIFNSSKSVTLSRQSLETIKVENLGSPKVLFLGMNEAIFNINYPNIGSHVRDIDVLLYRGFEGRKGFDYGLESLKTLSKSRNLKCGVLQGSKRAKLQANFVIYSELTDEQIADLFRRTRIFVYPSLFEGFGLPPLEAMACGCAVITTAVGAIPDYARHMEDVYIVKMRSSKAITKALNFLLDNPDALSRMQGKASESAKNYTWTRTADSFSRILDDRAAENSDKQIN